MADATDDTTGEPIVTPPVTDPAPKTPPASEGEKTPETKEQFVPYSRFKEVNDGLKTTRDELTANAAELARIKEAFIGPKAEEPYLDADAQKALEAYLNKQGFIRKEDLNKVTAAEQATRDLEALKTEQKLSDEDLEKVRAQAVKMGAANAEGLKAAYTTLFMDKIVEDKVKAALADKKPAPSSNNSSGNETPPQYSVKQSLKSRISAAASNLK